MTTSCVGFPGGSDGKESTCSAGNPGSIPPGSGRPPGGGHGNHSSILAWRSPMDRGAWRPQSVGSPRVRHDCVTTHSTAHAMCMLSEIMTGCPREEETKTENRKLSMEMNMKAKSKDYH